MQLEEGDVESRVRRDHRQGGAGGGQEVPARGQSGRGPQPALPLLSVLHARSGPLLSGRRLSGRERRV